MSLEITVNWLQNFGVGSEGTGDPGYNAFMDSQLIAAIFEPEPNKWGGVIEGFNCSLSGTNVVVTAGRTINYCDTNLSRGPYLVSGIGTTATVPITNTGPTSGTRIDQILVEVLDSAEAATGSDVGQLIIKPGQISQSIEAQDPFPNSTLIGIITWTNGTPVVSAGPRNPIGTRVSAGQITATELADLSVTSAKLATDSVNGAKIAAEAVSTSELADFAVSTAKIAPDAVNSAKIAAEAVSTSELADNAVSIDKIAYGTTWNTHTSNTGTSLRSRRLDSETVLIEVRAGNQSASNPSVNVGTLPADRRPSAALASFGASYNWAVVVTDAGLVIAYRFETSSNVWGNEHAYGSFRSTIT